MMEPNNNSGVLKNSLFQSMTNNKKIEILDIRDDYVAKQYPVANARRVPMMSLIMFYDELLDKNKAYYVYSEFGQRQEQVSKILELNGYHVIRAEQDLELVTI